jgi:hypothetical protein
LVQAAQHGGEVTALAVEDGIAYTGFGPSLITFRLVDDAPPERVGGSFALNFLARDLEIQDGSLYLLDGEGHLFLLSAGDPESMYVVQAFEEAGMSRVFVSGDWGFTTTNTCTRDGCSSLLQIFSLHGLGETGPVFGGDDIGPALPVQTSLEITGIVHNILVEAETVFIGHEKGLLAASLPGLEVLGELKTEYIHDAEFAMPYAYLSGVQLAVVDLTNPQALTRVNLQEAASLAPLSINEERLVGFDTFGEFGLCWSSVRVLSLEDPADPIPVDLAEGLPQFSCAWRAEVSGETLLVIDWDGLHFLDLSDPDRPNMVYSYAHIPGYIDLVQEGWAVGGSDRGPLSLWSYDLRDLEQVRSYGPFAPRWAISSVATGDYLYAPVWEDGMAVLDISNPSQPAVVTEIPVNQTEGPGLDVALLGDTLYLARGEGGLGVFELSDPARPSLVGGYSALQNGGPWQRTSRVSTGGELLVLLEEVWEGDLPGGILRVYKLGDPSSPKQAGEIEIDEPFLRSDLTSAGSYAYFMGSACHQSCTHNLLTADLKNPDAPAVLSSLRLPGEAYDIYLDGEYLFVAGGINGLYVWDMSDPANPSLAAHVDTSGPVEKVVTNGEWVYAAGQEAGLMIYLLN